MSHFQRYLPVVKSLSIVLNDDLWSPISRQGLTGRSQEAQRCIWNAVFNCLGKCVGSRHRRSSRVRVILGMAKPSPSGPKLSSCSSPFEQCGSRTAPLYIGIRIVILVGIKGTKSESKPAARGWNKPDRYSLDFFSPIHFSVSCKISSKVSYSPRRR